MRTASELLRATKEFAKEDWRSWWHLWSTLAVLGVLLAVACLPVHGLLRLPCSIAAGLVLVRMFIIYHDYQHGTILRGSRLAQAIMAIYGLCTLSPPSIWNRSHNHHHKHNAKILSAGIGSFPLMTTASYANASRAKRFRYQMARHPLTIACGYLTVFFYGMCVKSFLTNPRQHADSGLAILMHVAAVVALAIYAPAILVFALLLPGTIATGLGAYLFYAQHNFPGVQFQEPGDWDYVFASLHSSSCIVMGPVMCWLTGNIGYHHVHHLNARIPFYRLPEAMAAIEELQSPITTSLAPRDIRSCLRLKLWSPEQNSLVPFDSTPAAESSFHASPGCDLGLR